MFGFDPLIVALILSCTGILLVAAVRAGLSAAVRSDVSFQAGSTAAGLPDLHGDGQTAALIVGEGGSIRFANPLLREWLNLPADVQPNLEHLARRTEPEDVFLALCAAPGKARFSLKGMLVEGMSVKIGLPEEQVTLVTFQRPELTRFAEANQPDVEALAALTELNLAMTSGANLPGTVQAILESVERLVPADVFEITLWDPATRHLAPYRLAGFPGPDRVLVQAPVRLQPGEGHAGQIFQSQQPLLIEDAGAPGKSNGEAGVQPFPYRSYIGIPLCIGEQAVGTLSLASLTGPAYSTADIKTLQLIAGQAASALQFAQTRAEEQRRVAELTGLAQLTQAVSALRDPQDLYAQLIQSISPLLDVEVLGFLVYDENTHRLQGQTPFIGIPEHFIHLYGVEIEPGSPAAEVWWANETIVTANAAEDARLQVLGLAHLAQIAGIRSTAMVPLNVHGRSLGLLQAANKRGDAAFGGGDLRLLSIIAGQSAALIENAALLSEARRRIMQAEALRRIAALAGSAATLDEILQFSLNEVSRLLRADFAAIFLLDQENYELKVHPESLFGISAQGTRELPEIKVEDPRYARLVTSTQQLQVFRRGSTELEAEAVYKPLLESLQLESALSVPLIVSDRSVGEMVLGRRRPDHFQQDAAELAFTAAGQIAGAIERVLLASESSDLLRRRVEQLAAQSRISRALNTAGDFSALLQIVHTEAIHLAGASCGTARLFEPTSGPEHDPITIRATGDNPETDPAFSPAEAAALHTTRTVLNQGLDQTEFAPAHPEVKAELVVPISLEGVLMGLLSLHSVRPAAFGPAAMEAVETLADEAAITLRNMHARAALEHRVQSEGERRLLTAGGAGFSAHEFAALEFARDLSRAGSRKDVFHALGRVLVDLLGFDLCLVAESTPHSVSLVEAAGTRPEQVPVEALLGQRNPLRQVLVTGEPLRVQSGAHDSADWLSTPLLSQLSAGSFVCFPVFEADQLDAPAAAALAVRLGSADGLYPDQPELFTWIGEQTGAALAARRFRAQTEETLREVNLLLDFSRKLGSLEPAEVLQALADSAMAVVDNAQAVLIAIEDERTHLLIPQLASGYRDDAAMRSIRFGPGEALPGRVFTEGILVRLDEVNIAQEYNLAYENLLRYQEATRGRVPIASLAVPIATAGTRLGVLVLDNFNQPGAFTTEDEALIGSLARQTGLILENTRLLDQANRRAVQLSALTDVTATITSDLQVSRITASLLGHLFRVIPYDTGTVWLRQGETLTIRATQGFPDDEDRLGLSVAAADSQLLSDMVAAGRPIHVPNVHEDPRFMALAEFERLSWLGIPLLSKGEVVGVIALEKTEPHFYTPEHIQVATTFAGQAAVALENARLFEESLQRTRALDERTRRLALLNRFSTRISAFTDADQILQYTVQEMQESLGCRAATAVLFTDSGNARLAAMHPPASPPLPSEFDAGPFAHLRETLGVLIVEDVHAEPSLAPLQDFWSAVGEPAALVLSLATGETLHGLVILHSASRLSADVVDLARTISNQVAVAVENALLLNRLRNLTADLESRVEARTRELEAEHQRSETLLGIITELSASLDMDIVLNRTLALINRITGAEQSTIVLANPADSSLLPRATYGGDPAQKTDGSDAALAAFQTLAAWVIREREPALIPDLNQDDRWPKEARTRHRSALVIPLMLGAEALGALLLFHQLVGRFSATQLDLIQAAARQIAVAVNNAHLYLLIRDQAERLGGMLRSQQIESSRLRAILESVVDGVLVTDAGGLVSIFNRAGEQILHLAPDQVVGQSLDHFTGLFGKAGQKWMSTIDSWSSNPDVSHDGETFSEEIHLDDEHVVAVNLAPVFTPHEFLGTVSIFRDITHLIEVDRMKSEFVATVSHELRTPLTSIKGYVDILLMGAAGPLSEQQAGFLNVVQANTERLNDLVDDLLEVSRIEAGRVDLEFAPVNLAALAGEVATDYRLRAREEAKELAITVAEKPAPPQARGDAARLRQVLDNLLGNAYHYTPAGGRIHVSFRAADGLVEVAVKDSGVGISPAEHERIFERFYRGEAPLVTSVAGTGLGLSIVRHLVELHGGRIRVESRGVPGEGSTFLFTIPIYREEA